MHQQSTTNGNPLASPPFEATTAIAVSAPSLAAIETEASEAGRASPLLWLEHDALRSEQNAIAVIVDNSAASRSVRAGGSDVVAKLPPPEILRRKRPR